METHIQGMSVESSGLRKEVGRKSTRFHLRKSGSVKENNRCRNWTRTRIRSWTTVSSLRYFSDFHDQITSSGEETWNAWCTTFGVRGSKPHGVLVDGDSLLGRAHPLTQRSHSLHNFLPSRWEDMLLLSWTKLMLCLQPLRQTCLLNCWCGLPSHWLSELTRSAHMRASGQAAGSPNLEHAMPDFTMGSRTGTGSFHHQRANSKLHHETITIVSLRVMSRNLVLHKSQRIVRAVAWKASHNFRADGESARILGGSSRFRVNKEVAGGAN